MQNRLKENILLLVVIPVFSFNIEQVFKSNAWGIEAIKSLLLLDIHLTAKFIPKWLPFD